MRKAPARPARSKRVNDPAQYADLFDFAPVTYALIDAVGTLLKVNLAATRLLHNSRKELIGRPLLAFIVKQDRAELLEHFRRCRSGQRVVESEIRFAGNGHDPVTYRIFSKRVRYDGRAAYPTVIVDQSEHRRLDQARLTAERSLQQAERASEMARAGNAAKDRFLATVSHELRTPLTPALLAASQLSAWDGLPDEARELASTIKRNIQFEARLIDDLLDVARINRNRVELNLETVDAHELVQEAVDICSATAEGKRQRITVSLAAAAHHIKGDRLRLRQVFWNLLNNAIKFTPASGEIFVGSANVGGGVLRVSVRDTGDGMDASVLETLFAPFDRQSSVHDSRGGLGLGLSICKGIIASHEGQIWAMSDGPGRGSTFAVELATIQGQIERRAAVSKIDRTDHAQGAPRVLVVEDDNDSREMIVTFFSKYGYDVEAASTFDEAIDRLDARWDIVLTDLSLPGGSGLDIARRARALEHPPKRLIAFTGYGASDDLALSREAGFDDHLVKPLDLETLLKVVGGPQNATGHRRAFSAPSRVHARAKHR